MSVDTTGEGGRGATGTDLDRRLFVEMLREEWRLHSSLFGGSRFAAFPLFVALLGVAAVQFLTWAGTDLAAVVGGFHALVFAFGLHTGTIGLVGRDALRNLLGEMNLLVFTARTLPISQRRLLGVFLVKDAVYYTVLFLLPLSVAFWPVGVVRLPLLLGTATATFVLGLVVTFALVAASTQGRAGRVASFVAAAAVGLALAAGVDVVAWSPYALYADPSLGSAVQGLVAIPVLAAVGGSLYDTTARKPARTAQGKFRAWHARLSFDETGLVTKSLLDVGRSSGGFFKVVFSGGVLFAVSAYLISLTETLTNVEPSTGISFGAVLGLTAFTTYNWLTQFDDPEEYQCYPLSAAQVFAAKFRAFLVLGIPNGVAYFALALALFEFTLGEALVGLVLLVGLELYLFGLTVSLAGFQPNEFLFDTVLFALFGVAVAVVLVPVLVVGFVVDPVTTDLLLALAAGGVAAGAVGVLGYRRAVPKWSERLRT